MSIILFIVILAVLILVHEFGHFIVAKKSGIKVTEFGLGFPPKVASVKKGETEYSLNAIPFGGFVKIFGEDPNEASMHGPDASRSLGAKNRFIQSAVIIAGVSFNVVFAFLLLSFGYLVGMPASTSYIGPGTVINPQVVVTEVSNGSPADKAGIKAGDRITALASGKDTTDPSDVITPQVVSHFVEVHPTTPIVVDFERGKSVMSASVTPVMGLVAGKAAIGVGMDEVGTLKLSFVESIREGAVTTWSSLRGIVSGLYHFFVQIFKGHPDFSQVTGPVGIVGLVGDVSKLGLIYILSFTALISLNLAVINLIPFPALDGGRLVIIVLEGITRKQFNPKVINWMNTAGFAILILLMIVVTVHDIIKIV